MKNKKEKKSEALKEVKDALKKPKKTRESIVIIGEQGKYIKNVSKEKLLKIFLREDDDKN